MEVNSEIIPVEHLLDHGRPVLGPDYSADTHKWDSQQFLGEAYTAFDLRDSYLQRQAMPLASQADSIILRTDDYETKTCNVWRS